MKRLATALAAIALIGTPAFAADMAVKAPPPAPAPVYNWTGWYVGGNVGYSWGNDKTTVNFPGPTPDVTLPLPPPFSPGTRFFFPALAGAPVAFEETKHPNGAIGGVQVGYNWQSVSNWIMGIEADFQASDENATGDTHQNSAIPGAFAFSAGGPNPISGSGALGVSQSISHNDDLRWFGTVRGRLGYTIWPTVMLYATGGLAYGRLNESVSASYNLAVVNVTGTALSGTATFPSGVVVPLPVAASQTFGSSGTRTGWTVGAGVEGLISNSHVTWKIEYLYMDLGSQNYSISNPLLGTILVNTHFTDNIVRVGLNYQFH